ncbi:MAG: metallophosphoesterase family protein [Nanopusillaceae archaeon]
MKFIHVSDTHIGCQIPVKFSEIRKKDFLNSFKQVVDFALRENVDFIIHSGDFLDDYFRIDSTTIVEILDLLLKLKEKNIPLIYIKGNHDVKGQKQNILKIFEKLGLIIEAKPDEPYLVKDVYIYGISEPSNLSHDELRNYYKIKLSKIRFDNSGYRIFMFHGAIRLFPESILGKYYQDPRIVEPGILPDADYYAFGHFHKNYLWISEGKIYALPGSTERTEISIEEENAKKGFYYVRDNKLDFVEVKTRPIYIYEGELNNEHDLNILKEQISKKDKNTIIKIRLKYKKDYYHVLRNFIDSLEDLGYLILDDLYTYDTLDLVKIENDNSTIEDLINSSLFVSKKQELLEIFNLIREKIDEMYSGKDSDIERIRENIFYELIK